MPCQLDRPFKSYFPDVDASNDAADSRAHIRAYISIFDHWLTEDEAGACEIMSYTQAVELGVLDAYNDGEKRLMQFYGSISDCGVVCNRPGSLRLIDAHAPELPAIVCSSLREQRFMDLYFISARVRVMGGYDRTDNALLEGDSDLQRLKERAKKAGVFIL